MTIYFADFDNKLVDALVAAEAIEQYHRSDIVINEIVDAFIEIAGEDRCLNDSDDYEMLIDLAIESGNDWMEAYGDQSNRRAILFRMFHKATPILHAIEPAQDGICDENEIVVYNSGGIDFYEDWATILKKYLNGYNHNP